MLIADSPIECISSSISSARSVSRGPLLTKSRTTTYFNRANCSGVTCILASPSPMSSLAWSTTGLENNEDEVVVISSIISWIIAMNSLSSSNLSFWGASLRSLSTIWSLITSSSDVMVGSKPNQKVLPAPSAPSGGAYTCAKQGGFVA